MIAHILYYFSAEGDLVFDPMAGGGVVADTCLAFNRKCWSFDMDDRPDTRPEIEPYFWDITNLKWPIKGKTKPDLVLFDPPYFKKQSSKYDPDGISGLSKEEYLEFLENFFGLALLNAKKGTQMAFINADWRNFQGIAAREEDPGRSIFLFDYVDLLKWSGWEITHIIDCPLSLRGVGSLRAGGNATIPAKYGKQHAKKQNPWSRSTLPDNRKKKIKKGNNLALLKGTPLNF